MSMLVFGSLNIDRTYQVDHFVRPGETISAARMDLFCGGKGFNQSVALARAGNAVCFAGAVGADGGMLLDALDRNGIDRSHVQVLSGSTGHAVIQVDANGQNCIMILAGTNGEITSEAITETLSHFAAGDLIVLQNEISGVSEIIRQAYRKGMIIALNPSPCNERIAEYDLSLVKYLLINETEGAVLTGETQPEDILCVLHERYPATDVVLTLGGDGSRLLLADSGRVIACGIHRVQAVDTTAAGDTYTGYFLSAMMRGASPEEALRIASVAAGISVTRPGAEPSIPYWAEVQAAL